MKKNVGLTADSSLMLGGEANKLNGWKFSLYVVRDVQSNVGFVERARE
jgi:hypothetical protein